MDRTFVINVDGVDRAITADPATPLLYVLRNELGKKGPRFGCGLAHRRVEERHRPCYLVHAPFSKDP